MEQFESDAVNTGQVGTAPYDRIRRRKSVFTRDKNRLFLKQFVQQGPSGLIVIKVNEQLFVVHYTAIQSLLQKLKTVALYLSLPCYIISLKITFTYKKIFLHTNNFFYVCKK